MMKWNEYDNRLKKLYNDIVKAHSETTSCATSEKLETEVLNSMEELTNLLKNK